MNILFIIFNRPGQTKLVFEAIREAQPLKLFISADGPRPFKKDESRICEATRLIVSQIDWPCDVKTNFEKVNLGCKRHVSKAISWFFENVEEGIILEDDCLPSPNFFRFASEMLNEYRTHNKIMMISGNNLMGPLFKFPTKYIFSRYAHIWGWATWKRAWNKYDVDMKSFLSNKKTTGLSKHWKKLFNDVAGGKIDTWDAQWQYAMFKENGLSIIPSGNLVTNIGFGKEATHTKSIEPLANIPHENLSNLPKPDSIEANLEYDHIEEKMLKRSMFNKIINKIKTIYAM